MFRPLPRLALACLLLPAAIQTLAASPKLHSLQDEQSDMTKKTAVPSRKNNDQPVDAAVLTHPVLWHEPTDIGSLDLYYGQGGNKHQPKPPFTFVEEDRDGTNPKFDAKDADGKTWRCKVGDEARPEVVASRLLWAVGYYANDDYLLPESEISGLKMHRGSKDIRDGHVTNARYARKPGGQKKIGIWTWKENPFYGKREFNGLRVMMAVMNNWDLKDVNNSVYSDSKTGQQIFLVNDVGATFGSNGLGFSKARSKGNVDSFVGSRFIQNKTDTLVSFATPHAPTGVLLGTFGATTASYHMRSGLDWIGNDIPIEDARWMGSLLRQLSHKQLVDAFRAGSFPDDAIDAYVGVVESRIMELKDL